VRPFPAPTGQHAPTSEPPDYHPRGWVRDYGCEEGDIPRWLPIGGVRAPCVSCLGESDTLVCEDCRRRETMIRWGLGIAIVVAFIVGMWGAASTRPKVVKWSEGTADTVEYTPGRYGDREIVTKRGSPRSPIMIEYNGRRYRCVRR